MAVPVLAAAVAARAACRRLVRPEHVGKRDGAVVVVALIRLRTTVTASSIFCRCPSDTTRRRRK